MSHQPAVYQPAKLQELTEKELRAASAIYKSNGSCSQCHVVDGVAPTTETKAPNFSFAPGRLRAEWMRRWIAAPTTMQPMSSMAPLFVKDEKTGQWRFNTKLPELDGVDVDHIDLMVRYLLLGHAGK
jgi:hypothetical protein